MERLGKFEILEAKMWDEVMTTQSDKNEILVKLKRHYKKITSVTTYLTGKKAANEKLDGYNELLAEARNTIPSLMKLCSMRILKC